MLELPWYKKCLGYLVPVVCQEYQSDKHADLKIKYYQGQWQLESKNALYSDGYRYAPFRLAFSYLQKKNELLPIEHFLLLGAGLGSALIHLQKVYQSFPKSILVEHDEQIINLANEFFNPNVRGNVTLINDDVSNYLETCDDTFDLIGIDIFKDLDNSPLILNETFWEQVVKVARPKAHIIVNTIFIHAQARSDFEKLISLHFTYERLERSPNYIYILRLKHNNG